MGIDIYARWENQTAHEKAAQQTGFSDFAGRYGHLRENYPAWPSVTRHLVREAFSESDRGEMIESGAFIPAATLHERLPHALHLLEEKLGKYYEDAAYEELEPLFNDLIAFVALCERMEKMTGKPVNILAAI
jgi:arylsulfatase A-like enzyme